MPAPFALSYAALPAAQVNGYIPALASGGARRLHAATAKHVWLETLGGKLMKYGLAWLLGIPPVLIVVWFLMNRC
jgi:hypothetical protein